jgi:hypothetical protein
MRNTTGRIVASPGGDVQRSPESLRIRLGQSERFLYPVIEKDDGGRNGEIKERVREHLKTEGDGEDCEGEDSVP